MTKDQAAVIHQTIVMLEEALEKAPGAERLHACIHAVHMAMHIPGALEKLARASKKFIDKEMATHVAENIVGVPPEDVPEAVRAMQALKAILEHPNSQHDGNPDNN